MMMMKKKEREGRRGNAEVRLQSKENGRAIRGGGKKR